MEGGREERRGDLGRRDGRDEVKMNERAGLGAQGRQADKGRGGGEGQNERRRAGRGWGRGRLRGPAWAIAGTVVRGRRWRFDGLTRTRNCTKAQNLQRAGLARGGARGGRQGVPAQEGCLPCASLVGAPSLARAIQSFIRNTQEQATIRRAGEIARLSLAQLGLAGALDLPNQGAHVHPKKARPATVLFVGRPGCSGFLLDGQGTKVPGVKLSQWDCSSKRHSSSVTRPVGR